MVKTKPYPLKVKRQPPKPANPKLLAAPVPYRSAKSRRVLGFNR